MGVGVIVAGLAGVIMGEVIFGVRSICWVLFSVIGGLHRVPDTDRLGLRVDWIAPTDLKLLTAALVVVALSVPPVVARGGEDVTETLPATLHAASGIRKMFFPGTRHRDRALNGIDLEVPAGSSSPSSARTVRASRRC